MTNVLIVVFNVFKVDNSDTKAVSIHTVPLSVRLLQDMFRHLHPITPNVYKFGEADFLDTWCYRLNSTHFSSVLHFM